MKRLMRAGALAFGLAVWLVAVARLATAAPASVPAAERGRVDAERSGVHDANNLRTLFWNFGMVGDYPRDPANVDLSVFHSGEVPKGSGMNYSDGITPFVLAKVHQTGGAEDAYIMETGFRERQIESWHTNRIMRFEPRPGYFQASPDTNRGRSPAISNDPRTWPSSWPDRRGDPDDPGWHGSWDGYFGKRPAADQESFTVMDDDFYDVWDYTPDSTDRSRHGLGLKVEVRGFQWSNPQAGNVIFWHYDITNEGTTTYDDNVIFGLYMDSGVGGSALSCDGVYESDDDNAFFDKSLGLNLVYTWDTFGHGVDLASRCSNTGYLGYAYLETPGNPFDGQDNDLDGIVDEKRDGGIGQRIEGKAAIRAYVEANYDLARFEAFYGPLVSRPAFRAGAWYTGDEDMDWVADLFDVGADGVAGTGDSGEGDGVPTEGESNFDRTDLNESDQIGLTGFKMNRIKAGSGNPDPRVDDILFFTNNQEWPRRLYEHFTDPNPPARFDEAVAANYNIGFLFASGPFRLEAGRRERFSLALAYGADLSELRETVHTVQQIYNANYQFAVPPTQPTLTAETGDGYVRLSWDDIAERSIDPVSFLKDFEGYRIYRSTDPEFRDPRVITSGRGNPLPVNGKPIAQFDLVDGTRGYSKKTVEGVSYYLGNETDIRHTWTDTTVTNGQAYYYAVTAYDYGSAPDVPDSIAFYPSENSISVSVTPRGGLILPNNVVAVRPNPRANGFVRASADGASHVVGRGTGEVRIQVVNSNLVPHEHLFKVTFTVPDSDSIRATSYALTDSTTHVTFFRNGRDLDGRGVGPTASGLLPLVTNPIEATVDLAGTLYAAGSHTNTRLKVAYQKVLSSNLRRPGYPDDITITFDDVVRDTAIAAGIGFQARPAKFVVVAHSSDGDRKLDFRFRDFNNDSTLSRADELIDIMTFANVATRDSQVTWRVQLDTLGQGGRGPIIPPRRGDVFKLRLARPLSSDDVFVFSTDAQRVDTDLARSAWDQKPYVVPNPYVGAAAFEPQRFAISGRGERRVEFRAIPQGGVIRIYTVRGDLVQTLRQNGSNEGFVAWNLRTKDNIDVAPGLYVFHVDAPGIGEHVGKFAIIR